MKRNKTIAVFATSAILGSILFSNTAFAHIQGEKNLFDDIGMSKAQKEIVYMVGTGIITPDEKVKLFNPQDNLKKADLAYWVASFDRLGNANSQPEDLEKLAVQKGLITSLDGDATYEDVNKAYFGGKLQVSNPTSTLSREDFAIFMDQHLLDNVNGKTLMEQAGLVPGPTGTIQKVDAKDAPSDGDGDPNEISKTYTVTIGGQAIPVYEHAKVVFGNTDITQDQGKQTIKTWMKTENGTKEIAIMEFNKDNTQPVQKTPATPTTSEENSFPYAPVIGGVVLVGILAWLFGKKKK